MAKIIKSKQTVNVDDGLQIVQQLSSFLNQSFKKTTDKLVYNLSQEQISPTDIPFWASTGSDILDIIISNIKNGGMPFSKIVQLSGLQGSGKSFIGSHVLANTQKQGGIAIYIDSQASVNRDFLKNIGIDLQKLIYIPENSTQKIFTIIQKLIGKIRQRESNKPVAILIDSITASSTQSEIEGEYKKQGWNTDKAIILSKAMRKLTTLLGKQKILLMINSQVRTNLGVTFGDKYTTPGGHAIKFHASVRLRLSKATKIKDAKNNIVGINLKIQIIKNRLAPPHKTCQIPLYFTSGIDNYQSWLAVLKNNDITNGRSIQFNNKKYSFTMATFGTVVEQNPELKQYLYDKLCDILISKYDYEQSVKQQVFITDQQVQS